ncbi:hypothetical protein [Methylocystis heyeri]|uniref:Uncharacterized protein n=1 Tax=Methylocystis heyeri TaxID=391905 RepID=A0A6B8KE44_9HYPH|nr:hypothetical protein [Methylocystis heyeri]QGM45872.1 hypothetical protein H2LOC_009250 [Methylocystis heyeri]
MPKLTIQNQNFIDPSGKQVRFWGVDLVEFYPDHATAAAFAKNLAARGVNLVRWHKMLMSEDNNNYLNTQGGKTPIESLATYGYDSNGFPQGTSRAYPSGADARAWDRFDFLNAELQRNGIYLMMSIEFGRTFTPADQAIYSVNSSDDANWRNAISAMNNWGNYLFNIDTGGYAGTGSTYGNGYWQNTFDKWKFLPAIDERSARLYEEFVGTLLTHVNPYSALAYGQNTQVATMEVVNESSSYYLFANAHHFDGLVNSDGGVVPFPPSLGAIIYFNNEIQSAWYAFSGQSRTNLYQAVNGSSTRQQQAIAFLTGLDQKFIQRMKQKIASLGYAINLSFSNLWRSEDDARLDHDLSSHSDNHTYMDPFVVEGFTRSDSQRHRYASEGVSEGVLNDFVYEVSSQKAFVDRPQMIGEVNMLDWYDPANTANDTMHRSMMMVATAAYGSLHNWSSFAWYSATQGGNLYIDDSNVVLGMGADGWGVKEAEEFPLTRDPDSASDNYNNYLGWLWQDGQKLDHMRTAGLIFRNGMIAPSTSPITIYVDAPYSPDGTNDAGQWPPKAKYLPKPGWADISAIRKAYGTVPGTQASAKYMTTLPTNPLVSDTGQIIKDVARQQLTVSSPQAEAFSGNFDRNAPAGLKVLRFPTTNTNKFATVILASNDGAPLASSRNVLVSRTYIDIATKADQAGPKMTLAGLQKAGANQQWQVRYTRPRANYANPAFAPAPLDSTGAPTFTGTAVWTEAELQLVTTSAGAAVQVSSSPTE